MLRFSVVSVALGSDGNTLFPKIHRADSNGGPQAQDGGDGSQPGGSVAIAPSSDQGMSRFFRVAPALLRVCPVPLAGVASVRPAVNYKPILDRK